MTHASIAVKPDTDKGRSKESFFKNKTFCFGDICGDGVEDVDQDEEDGDQERHPPGDHVRGDQERDPGHHDEHPGGEVTRDDVVRHLQWCCFSIMLFVFIN